MTVTPMPAIDSGDDRLADEISDVIEEHGRGLGAEAVSSAIERVAVDLDEEFDESISANELQHELHRFVDDHLEQMDREAFVETLREIAEDLRQGSLTPDVAYRRSEEGDEQVALIFDSAFALRQKLPRLLDFRGYFVEIDRVPVAREDITVTVEGAHVDERVELNGCVLRSAPNGMALRIHDAGPSARRKLRELARTMRQARRTT